MQCELKSEVKGVGSCAVVLDAKFKQKILHLDVLMTVQEWNVKQNFEFLRSGNTGKI